MTTAVDPSAARALLDAFDGRQFSEELHPRVPAGSAGGGQFGSKSGQSKEPAKKSSGSGSSSTSKKPDGPKPQHVDIPKGSFGYDPASNHGTGYGSKNGDKNVHTLQEALNRLGLTDMHGRKLTNDGKLGPLTTSAVKKAQKALGLKADGIVSPAFLKQLSALKTLPKKKMSTAVRRALADLGFDVGDVDEEDHQDQDDDEDTDPIGDLDGDTMVLLLAMEEYESDDVDDSARAWDASKHPRGPDGKFRKLIDRIKDALDDHAKKGGKGDPFADFDREQLRKAALSRGIKLQRGEDRDSIAQKLIADLKGGAAAKTATPAPSAKAAGKAAPKPGSKTAQRPSLNGLAIQDAKDDANRKLGASHTATKQLSAYDQLTKADFDSIDSATRTWILADLSSIKNTSRGKNGTRAAAILQRFSPPGTPVGVTPKPPVIPPAAAKTAKKAAPTPDGTPGLLKKAKDQGADGDGWFYPPGGGKAVWGKFGAAGLLLRHRGDDGVDRYLMVQRGPGISDPGKWQFPGGAIDSKETVHEGATREVLEELGFKESDLAAGLVHGEHEASVAGGAWKYTSIAATVPKQLVPDLSGHHARMETSDAKWMTIEEIRKLDSGGKLLAPLAGGKLEQNVVSLFPAGKGKAPKPKAKPLPKHKPSKGRDLLSDKAAIDKLRQDVKHDRHKYAGKTADDRLAAIGAMQGYDDVPTVATKEEIDKLLATGDYIEVWRGVSGAGWGGKSAAVIHEEMRSGPAWYGKGVFGNGYYLASDKKVAEQYSDGTPGSVARILIPKAAVTTDYQKVIHEARAAGSRKSKAKGGGHEESTLWDAGRFAAAKGVDGIVIQHNSGAASGVGLSSSHVASPSAPAYNWLNRSVLIIQEG